MTSQPTSTPITAASAGTWKLGDREVNRLGLGAMRLTGNGMRGNSDGAPIDRDRATATARSRSCAARSSSA